MYHPYESTGGSSDYTQWVWYNPYVLYAADDPDYLYYNPGLLSKGYYALEAGEAGELYATAARDYKPFATFVSWTINGSEFASDKEKVKVDFANIEDGYTEYAAVWACVPDVIVGNLYQDESGAYYVDFYTDASSGEYWYIRRRRCGHLRHEYIDLREISRRVQ